MFLPDRRRGATSRTGAPAPRHMDRRNRAAAQRRSRDPRRRLQRVLVCSGDQSLTARDASYAPWPLRIGGTSRPIGCMCCSQIGCLETSAAAFPVFLDLGSRDLGSCCLPGMGVTWCPCSGPALRPEPRRLVSLTSCLTSSPVLDTRRQEQQERFPAHNGRREARRLNGIEEEIADLTIEQIYQAEHDLDSGSGPLSVGLTLAAA